MLRARRSIDLGAKIMLAQQDLANECCCFCFGGHSVATTPLGRFLRIPESRDVKDVVVTEPLRQWHVHRTLALVYRDAYNNQLNNRYQGKWAEYETSRRRAHGLIFRSALD